MYTLGFCLPWFVELLPQEQGRVIDGTSKKFVAFFNRKSYGAPGLPL